MQFISYTNIYVPRVVCLSNFCIHIQTECLAYYLWSFASYANFGSLSVIIIYSYEHILVSKKKNVPKICRQKNEHKLIAIIFFLFFLLFTEIYAVNLLWRLIYVHISFADIFSADFFFFCFLCLLERLHLIDDGIWHWCNKQNSSYGQQKERKHQYTWTEDPVYRLKNFLCSKIIRWCAVVHCDHDQSTKWNLVNEIREMEMHT